MTWRYILFFLCFWGVIACKTSSSTVSHPNPQASSSETGADFKKKNPLSTDADNVCEIYDNLSEYMFGAHLARKSSERAAFSQKVLEQTLLDLDQSFVKKANLKRDWSLIRKNLDARGSETSDCKAYLMLAEQLLQSDSIRSSLGFKATDRAALQTIVVRSAIDDLARSLDGVSHYRTPYEQSRQSGDTTEYLGVGLFFHRRTDYAFDRTPPYLVIEGAWPNSPNAAKISTLMNMRITGIEVFDDEALKKLRETKPDDVIEHEGRFFIRIEGLGYYKAHSLLNDLSVDDEDKTMTLYVLARSPEDQFLKERVVELAVGSYTPLPVRAAPVKLSDGRWITYLRLSSFGHDYLSDVMKNEITTVDQRLQSMGARSEGMLLDLRGNPGGNVNQLDRVLSIFMKSGTTFAYEEETQFGYKPEQLKGRPQGTQNGKPTVLSSYTIQYGSPDFFEGRKNVVVLVDRESASAAEVAPATLHDYRKAWVLGEKTYGKAVGMNSFSPPEPIRGVLSINDMYIYSASGRSYLMDPYFVDTLFVDPVNEEQNRIYAKAPNGAYAYGIEYDFRRASADGSFSIPKPVPPRQSLGLTPGEEAWLDAALIAQLTAYRPEIPESCKKTPLKNPGQFKEEDDCLRDLGLLYLEQIIRAHAAS